MEAARAAAEMETKVKIEPINLREEGELSVKELPATELTQGMSARHESIILPSELSGGRNDVDKPVSGEVTWGNGVVEIYNHAYVKITGADNKANILNSQITRDFSDGDQEILNRDINDKGQITKETLTENGKVSKKRTYEYSPDGKLTAATEMLLDDQGEEQDRKDFDLDSISSFEGVRSPTNTLPPRGFTGDTPKKAV